MRLSGMLIDTAAARRMNRAYYEDNIELSFRTEAMYTKYQTAFARYLYDYIAKNFQFRETVNVLELGPDYILILKTDADGLQTIAYCPMK